MKTPESIHAQYNILSKFIHTNDSHENTLFENLEDILANNIPSEYDEDLANARRCIESLTETIQLVMGWLEIDAKLIHKEFTTTKQQSL